MLESKRLQDEALFVNTTARPAFTFYQYAGIFNTNKSNVYLGKLEKEIDTYRQNGNQFWVMHCHCEPNIESQFGEIVNQKNLKISETYFENNICLLLLRQ